MGRSESLILSWKNRKDYTGEFGKTSLYASWRSRVFTTKGRICGFPKQWETFNGFKDEMMDGWSEGKILVRKNSKLPFSKENCEWQEKGTENCGKLVKLSYDGKEQTLLEWCKELKLNYNGARQRYFKGKAYTPEQILFGKMKAIRAEIVDSKLLSLQRKRDKISKMISAYRIKDKNKDMQNDLTRNFFEDNIISKPCSYCGSEENVGCDRIDNSKGHTMDNVIPCCYICNTVRNRTFTVDEMKILGIAIAEIRSKWK